MAERPIACAEWQDDLAAWLMAQIAPDREAALAQHLSACSACRAEADSLLAVAALALAADPDEAGGPAEPAGRAVATAPVAPPLAGPPPALERRVLGAVARARRQRRLARAGAVALAGAAAAAALVVGVVVVRDDGPAPLRGETIAFTLVPDGASASAVVAPDTGGSGSLVELQARGLDPATTYALWLTPPGGGWEDRVPAGTFRPDESGAVDVRLHSALPADAYGRAWATTPAGKIALDTE